MCHIHKCQILLYDHYFTQFFPRDSKCLHHSGKAGGVLIILLWYLILKMYFH